MILHIITSVDPRVVTMLPLPDFRPRYDPTKANYSVQNALTLVSIVITNTSIIIIIARTIAISISMIIIIISIIITIISILIISFASLLWSLKEARPSAFAAGGAPGPRLVGAPRCSKILVPLLALLSALQIS